MRAQGGLAETANGTYCYKNQQALAEYNHNTQANSESPRGTMTAIFPSRPPPPNATQIEAALQTCLKVSQRAVANSKQPFGACLTGPDNEEILLTHGNVDHVNHAESSLARLAALHYSQPFLWTCTLYSTWEPCAMCTATCYWANIGTIVYFASEEKLLELTGTGNEENMTMAMPCRKVLEGSQKAVQILGPFEELIDVVVEASDEYWRPLRQSKEHAHA
ncbi:cytidine deaminase-like protein [Teratosphaeria nubilosa]|uniref:Cytidine deaminase-like protein n=1 Tax=Teratosphaeria nubilosa TaxID=161662 RepID=A0A6G1LE05_9PEZI|nr:cytidine deaminase-like protein [Teratosphaeria nubilosa]